MILITNAYIMPMQGEPIEKGYLRIEDATIKEIGLMESLDHSINAKETFDVRGKTILPGFIDAHTHLGMSEDGVGDEGEDINEMSDPVTPHIRAIDAIDPLDNCMSEALSAGITTAIVTPGSANPIAGQIAAIKTYGQNIEEMIVAEPLAMKFSMGENPKRVHGHLDQMPMSRMATAAIIRENLFKTIRYMEEKTKAIDEDSDLPEFDFKYESLIPLIERKIKAHFHAHRAYDIQTAIRIAKEFDLDYIIIHGTEGHRIAPMLAQENCSVVCGPIIGTRSKPELSRQILENASELLKSGVTVAIASDHPEVPVEFLALSASILANHGISKEQALLGITYASAKVVGLENRVGSLKVGLDADILVFDGDPLAVGSKPEMVFVGGVRVI